LFVLAEQLLAVQAVGQRGEAATGDAGDDVDCIEQAHVLALRSNNLGTAKKLENSVGKGGGARATAREGENDQVFLVPGVRLARLEAVARTAGRPA
jgi:hypothetical protein